jgi:hypothetical protein
MSSSHDELCSLNKCIQNTFDEVNVNSQRSCKDYNPSNCFGAKDEDMPFYNSLDWNKLTAISDQMMNQFMEHLNRLYFSNHSKFQDLLKSVFPNIVARGAAPNYLFRKVENLVNEQNRKCNDINFSFHIECQTDAGAVNDKTTHTIRIFHIAIHSEKPKYFELNKPGQAITRSMYTCGFFPKSATDSGIDFGSFHYKIDNYALPKKINSSNCKSKIEEMKCPFKKMEPDNETPGKLKNVENEIFQNLSFPVEFDSVMQENFIKMHALIYKAFIEFWNTVIFPLVEKSARRASASRSPRASSSSAKRIPGGFRKSLKILLRKIKIKSKKIRRSIK